MVSINASAEVNAPVERIWSIVSNVDRDPAYWKGMNSSKTIRREENVIEREVNVGFMGHKGHQIVKLNPKTSVDIEMTDGPMVGSRKLKLVPLEEGKTRLEASWDYTFSKVPIFARSFVKSQIERVTKEALEKIALEAEEKNKPTNKVVLVSLK
jgi:ribosome-associated toxin RatA of RatAB toxin-antitoxin module